MVCLYYKVALITVFAIEDTNSVSYRPAFPCDGKQEGLGEKTCHTALTQNITRIAKFEWGGQGNLKWVFPCSTSLLIVVKLQCQSYQSKIEEVQ